MYKHNIIIPKRGRDSYFEVCLNYLNKASQRSDSYVNVYIISETPFLQIDEKKYSSLHLYSVPILFKKEFCRGNMLNRGLSAMEKDFDFVSIMDLDMIYHEDFFKIVQKEVKDNIYFMSGGVRLTKDITERGMKNHKCFDNISSDDTEPESVKLNSNKWYPSQITLTKNLYNKLLVILKTDNLYHEGFIGWGGEDSYLSFFSTECEKQKLLKKVYSYNIWYHLWHEAPRKVKGFDEVQYKKNVKLLWELHEINKVKLQNYVKETTNV